MAPLSARLDAVVEAASRVRLRADARLALEEAAAALGTSAPGTSVRGATYKGRKVKLNKPFRTPNGPKKFGVYVKNDKGNVVVVRFGDPNMRIKKTDPDRRRSFRARHRCDDPGPKWKARYWACKAW
jgi:hypothetical protein